jgi:hypothetical protein
MYVCTEVNTHTCSEAGEVHALTHTKDTYMMTRTLVRMPTHEPVLSTHEEHTHVITYACLGTKRPSSRPLNQYDEALFVQTRNAPDTQDDTCINAQIKHAVAHNRCIILCTMSYE